MQLDWLQRQLAQRGIDARYIYRLELCCGFNGRLWLELECDAVNRAGKPLVAHTSRGAEVVRETHVVPIGGLVLDIGAW